MAETSKTTEGQGIRAATRADAPGGAQPHERRLLPVSGQIASLRERGVSFKLCSEADAADYLSTGNNLLRASSYRKLFSRQVDGPDVGRYVNLDFAHLVALSQIDRRLRDALLLAAADVEHFVKMRLLRRAEERGEDGLGIVADFYASLSRDERRRMKGRLSRRGSEGEGHDSYTGDLIAHYGDEPPLWVLVEVLEFGAFLTLYKYCAGRWGDAEMEQEHYVLKSVKALRNACAHGSCLVNGFCAGGPQAEYHTNALIAASLNDHGMRNTKTRRAKLRNLRIAQIAATLYALDSICDRRSTRERNAERFDGVRRFYRSTEGLFAANDGILSFFDFLWRLVDIWCPKRA